jgi:hypothetical protein
MKKAMYYGVKRSGITMEFTMSKALAQPEAFSEGLLVPKSGKKCLAVGWGDVMVCLKEALAVSPEMRADLKAMLEEQALVVPKEAS